MPVKSVQQSSVQGAQPWKKHWPPVTSAEKGDYHGTPQGKALAVCGGGVGRLLTEIPREQEHQKN